MVASYHMLFIDIYNFLGSSDSALLYFGSMFFEFISIFSPCSLISIPLLRIRCGQIKNPNRFSSKVLKLLSKNCQIFQKASFKYVQKVKNILQLFLFSWPAITHFLKVCEVLSVKRVPITTNVSTVKRC